MIAYATIADIKRAMAADESITAAVETLLFQAVLRVSRRVDAKIGGARMRPAFAPYAESRTVRVTGSLVNSRDNTLRLEGDLLALTGVTRSGETLAVGSAVEAWPDGTQTPIRTLRLTDAYSSWYDNATSDAPPTVTLTGVWGYHSDYAHAWAAVDTVQDNPLSASATTLTVTDVDGVDLWGFTPRMDRGNLLRIGDEYLVVTAVDTVANTATVRRGVNGTTAAEHAQGASVEVWQVDAPLRDAVARQVGFTYQRRGAYIQKQVTELGAEIRFPDDLLPDLENVLENYQWRR